MDKHTKAIYRRGAMFVVPIALIVGCRVGLRACVAIGKSDRRSVDEELRRQDEQARKAAELAAAMATSEATQRARTRTIPTATKGSVLTPIASGQQVPDALAVDADVVAWLNTRAGEVVVAPRAGGASRIVAKNQKLSQRRHLQGLALSGGYVYWFTTTPATSENEDGAIVRIKTDADGSAEPEVVLSELTKAGRG